MGRRGDDMLSVGVAGAGGKMGSLIVRLVVESGDLQLAGALEVPGHPGVGRDAGELAGKGTTGVRITDGVGQAFDG
ncbi:MAG TPA: 4-hydroxy-tetrahydrodipicolinate reductase, partial [Deltaproteobacteria bacterium]|nr:4-hydroxy-tetrahydrodipicolinate reductase [Deltaproteobacteria bacterium]